jgi:hypothetical protein
VLLDGGDFWQERVKFPVVAEDNPAFSRDFRKPCVVGCRLRKPELALGVVVKLDGKRRLRCPDRLGEAFAEIPIKIEC